jgi:hypothetical protein
MKKIFCLILYSFSYLIVIQAQSDCGQDSIKYLIAYNYIVNDYVTKGKTITVSDSIIDLDRFWFSEELKNYPEEQRRLNQYRENKGFIWSDPFYSSCITSMFPVRNVLANNILFFSQIEDDILLADVFPYKNTFINWKSDKYDRDRMFNYNQISMFTVVNKYLFIFDKDETLKLSIHGKMTYE